MRDQQAWKVTVNAGDSVYIDLNGGTEAYLDGVRIAVSGSYRVTRSCTLTFAYKGTQKSIGWEYDAAGPALQPDGRFPMSRYLL